MNSHLLTHSRMSCFRACPRKHELRYELGLQPTERSFALRVGTAFHAALEAIDNRVAFDDVLDEQLPDPYDRAVVAALVSSYREFWSEHPLEVLATELPFQLPLRNPETGYPTPNWHLAGVIDRIVRLPDGRLAMQEYKTTTRDTSPGSDYWVALRKDQQVSIYVSAARELGYDVQTVLYDVTRRPLLRPRKATPVEKRRYTKEGRLYATDRENDEDPMEFLERVLEAIREAPENWFQRVEIARLDQDLEDCAHELWQQQLAIRAMQRSGRWYRNPSACFEPFACDFLAICELRDLATNTPSGFVRSDDVHPELSQHATESGLVDSATAAALPAAQD